MKVAAYKQYNKHISEEILCCSTGRMKKNYGVQPVYRLVSGDKKYKEKHNGWWDAMDELRIMQYLNLPLEAYKVAKI